MAGALVSVWPGFFNGGDSKFVFDKGGFTEVSELVKQAQEKCSPAGKWAALSLPKPLIGESPQVYVFMNGNQFTRNLCPDSKIPYWIRFPIDQFPAQFTQFSVTSEGKPRICYALGHEQSAPESPFIQVHGPDRKGKGTSRTYDIGRIDCPPTPATTPSPTSPSTTTTTQPPPGGGGNHILIYLIGAGAAAAAAAAIAIVNCYWRDARGAIAGQRIREACSSCSGALTWLGCVRRSNRRFRLPLLQEQVQEQEQEQEQVLVQVQNGATI